MESGLRFGLFFVLSTAPRAAALSPRAVEDARRQQGPQQRPRQGPSEEILGGPAYIDETTAYCYEIGINTSFADPTMDQNYDKSIERVTVKRPNTQLWCLNDMDTPPSECQNLGKPPADAPAPCPENITCTRGYDLVQTPPGATCNTPRILWIHGGSWYDYSPWSYAVHTSKIAKESGAIVLSIDYPLIGGWTWPVEPRRKTKYAADATGMLEFARNAWEWLAEHGPNGEKCNCLLNKPPMIIAGDSSGGGTAWALMMDLQQKERTGSLGKLRFPTGGFFESPWTNLACNTGTYYSNNFAAFPNKEFASAHPRQGSLTGDLMFNDVPDGGARNVGNPWSQTLKFALNALQMCGCNVSSYASEVPETCPGATCSESPLSQDQLTSTIFSPYWASEDELRGLPPLFFAASASELLAGDTSVLAEKAAKVGVIVRTSLFYGMWHTFPQWSEGCGGDTGPLWQGVAALQQYGEFVKEVTHAYKKCPSKLRTTDGGNWFPKQPTSVAVNSMHQVAGENATGAFVAIPELDLDICGDSWWPAKGASVAQEEVALAAGGAATGGKRQRRLRSHRPVAGEDEAAALLQMSLGEDIGEEEAFGSHDEVPESDAEL